MKSMTLKEMWRNSAFLLVLLAAFLQYRIHEIESDDVAMVATPPEYLGTAIDHRIMRRFLGLRIIVSDLAWIDLMMKSDIIRGGEPYSPFYRSARTVVTLDPDHYFGYYIAGIYLSVIKDDIKGATAILRDGAQYIQRNYAN